MPYEGGGRMRRWSLIVITTVLFCCSLPSFALGLTAVGLETESVSRSWENSVFFERMEELTGIAVEAKEETDKAKWQTTLKAMEDGSIPAEMLFKAELTRSQEKSLLDSGALVDLSPYIDDAMPNLSELLLTHPEWRERITLQDGRIAALPLINPEERQVCCWINQSWLEKLGFSTPESIEELTKVLEAFLEGDPNGNGIRDEIAADLTGIWEMKWLLPYFGIVADDWNLTRLGDGKLAFAPELQGYRSFVALLTEWREKGILSDSAFTDLYAAKVLEETTSSSSQQKDRGAVSGLMISPSPLTRVSADNVMDYQTLLIRAGEETVWRDLLGPVWTGCFAVTSSCKDITAALRWADALYTEEGGVLAYAGKEQEEWIRTQDGGWRFLISDMRSIEDIRRDALISTGAAMPGLYPSGFLSQVDSPEDRWIASQNARVSAVSSMLNPADALSDDKLFRAIQLNSVLTKLVDEGIGRFATGEVALDDANWKKWLEELHAAGSRELVELFNSAKGGT